MKKRSVKLLPVIMVLTLMVSLLTGCKKGSEYSNATVSIPATYAKYNITPLHFRFEAGWHSSEFDTVQDQMDLVVGGLGVTNQLCVFSRLASPPADQGTVNYLDLCYMQMNHEVETVELEDIMGQIDTMGSTIKKTNLGAEQLQRSRIRCYGDDELEALTFCYKVTTNVNGYDINCVEQVALVPWGSRVYIIVYSDFTTGADSQALEQILSSLSITE